MNEETKGNDGGGPLEGVTKQVQDTVGGLTGGLTGGGGGDEEEEGGQQGEGEDQGGGGQ